MAYIVEIALQYNCDKNDVHCTILSMWLACDNKSTDLLLR